MSNYRPNPTGRQISPSELRLRKKMREKRRKQRQRRRLCLLALFLILIIAAVFFGMKVLKTLDKEKTEQQSSSQSESSLQSQQPQNTEQPQSSQSDQPQSDQQAQDSSQQTESTPPNADVSSTTKTDDWRMILANKNTPLPEGYAPELVTLADSSLKMQKEAAEAFDTMREAANATGLNLMACSTYRSVERQTELFNDEVEKWKKKGMSEEEAKQKAATVVMLPGCSEHNTGLAVDVGSITNQRIEEDFENEPEFAWLQEHAAEYGFILRYPKEKQAITGVTYEPWHYRYVGVENAKAIKASGLCLEEYLAQQS